MHAKTHVQSQMKLQVILNYINYNKGEVENQNVYQSLRTVLPIPHHQLIQMTWAIRGVMLLLWVLMKVPLRKWARSC